MQARRLSNKTRGSKVGRSRAREEQRMRDPNHVLVRQRCLLTPLAIVVKDIGALGRKEGTGIDRGQSRS